MTSISGTSSSSGSMTSQLTAAKGSLLKLLISSGMMASLDSTGSSQKPGSQQVLSTLWSVFDANGGNTITKSDVQAAVANLGGSKTDASAIWSLISPYGLNNISKTSFNNNSVLTSTVNANISAIQKAFAVYSSSATGIAENAMSKIMTSTDVVQALASESSAYVPPTTNQMISTVWALFDANNSKTISQSDVNAAVVAEGGKPSDARAIWSQLSPHGASSINAAQFIASPFITAVITANKQNVTSTVSKVQLLSTGTSNSVLDSFSSTGADILNGAATGYNDSPVGAGGSYFNYLNLFV